jgi:adenylate cyclase
VQDLPTENRAAHEFYLRARALHVTFTPESLRMARALFEKAIALDPDFGLAYAGLARVLWEDFFHQRSTNLQQPIDLAEKALALKEDDAYTHAVLCLLRTIEGRMDEACDHGRRAVDLNPNDPTALAHFVLPLLVLGEIDEGIAFAEQAVRVDPHEWTGYASLGSAYLFGGRLQDALSHLRHAADMAPDFIPQYLPLALAYELDGRPDEAEKCIHKIRELNPHYTIAGMRRVYGKVPEESGAHVYMDLARKYGLSEGDGE